MSAGSIYPGLAGNSDVNVHNRSTTTAGGTSGKVDSILIPTTLNFSNEEVRFWNNLTFFFDRWWEPETERLTLPFCMFQVAQYSDTQQAEVSKKRVMVYQPPTKSGGSEAELVTDGGAMQVVVDNIVVQPKVYNMTLIVPSSPVGRWIKSRMQLQTYFQQVLEGFYDSLDDDTKNFMQSELTRMADTKAIMNEFISRTNVSLPNMTCADEDYGRNMANKNALDAMIEHGRIVMFKSWMGNDYKYGVITNKVAEKKGTEDGVWRVQVTFQEVPLLSLTPVTGVVKKADQGWVQGYTDNWGEVFGIKNMGTNMPAFQQEEASSESST